MSFLDELIGDASGDAVALPVLLRRVKVLAARLRTTPLADWVEMELAGYGPDDELPSYRGPFPAQPVGHFAGPFGSEIRNGPIPSVAFDKGVRDDFEQFFVVEFREGIASLEEVARRSTSDGQDPAFAWPANAVAWTNSLMTQGKVHLHQGHGLVDARTPVPIDRIASVLDTVRTRVLDLALAIEAEDPEAGRLSKSSIPPERAENIFHTVIMGGNVAIQSQDVTQEFGPPQSEDQLLERLSTLGLPGDLIDELKNALKEDRESGESTPSEPGSRVQRWLGKVSMMSAKAGAGVAVGASGDIVAKLVMGLFES